jgi:hypothetical protein
VKKFQFISSILFAGALVLPACGESDSGGDTTGAGVTSQTTSDSGTGDSGADGTDGGTATTTTTTSGGTDGTTGGDDGQGFVPDGGGASCGEECDIWNPMDCPDGEKCTAVACEVGGSAWDSNVCREVQGTAAVGDECMYTDGSGVSGNDTCELGAMCWNADADTGLGTCIAFCTGSPDAASCPAGTNCVIVNNGVLAICLPGCDPLAQDCEAGDDLCIPDPNGEGYVCVLNASGDMAPYGTPCNYANSCNAGLICIDAAGVPEAECASASGCCSPMCSISGGDACPGTGQTCEPVFDPQPPGYEDVGVCTIAM